MSMKETESGLIVPASSVPSSATATPGDMPQREVVDFDSYKALPLNDIRVKIGTREHALRGVLHHWTIRLNADRIHQQAEHTGFHLQLWDPRDVDSYQWSRRLAKGKLAELGLELPDE